MRATVSAAARRYACLIFVFVDFLHRLMLPYFLIVTLSLINMSHLTSKFEKHNESWNTLVAASDDVISIKTERFD